VPYECKLLFVLFGIIFVMGKGRKAEPYELVQLVRERCPDYDDNEDDLDELERFPDQSKPTRILWRGPLTEDEQADVVNWIIQRIRCLARIPVHRAPTELEMFVAATMMLCLIRIIDTPPRPEDEGAAFFDMSELSVSMDIILISRCSGLAYVRKVAHELAQRLMITEVASEIFWASEVCIEDPGWDNVRERHKLAWRAEEGLIYCGSE
jgi:hypothetical protein